MTHVTRILILGGTAEAAVLARRLADRPALHVTTSLAGRTRRPATLPGHVRIGGFGGVPGLTDYLRSERITVLIDATHPFATHMPFHARDAAARLGTPLLRLERPAWRPKPGDRWTTVPDLETAAGAIPAGARVFLTTGRQDLAPFAVRDDAFFLIRSIEPPDVGRFRRQAVILGRGPFTVANETALLRRHAIDLLVTKNSGAEATAAKLEAARRLGLPVVMVERPPRPQVATAAQVDDALAWMDRMASPAGTSP
ncbi:cobalt-precorrin-6A reductase [Marinivivus vitaminiproducens]|uniref:cobalt-precorrin-6A reductase n=1 Tax=Marinivivus vitaminiproducens TaxID=3035935 RepID=UPI00279FFD31|nr:cobalt-precorrin-6A reductase [Geminicoccaceae bacterium SCSIO 64248]